MRATPLCTAIAAVSLSIACAQPSPPAAEPALVERSHTTMGSPLQITVATDETERAELTIAGVFREIDRLDAMMTIWKPGSEVLQLNAAAGVAPVKVSQEMREVLTIARQASDWTGGKFDITFGALAGLWKFDAQNQDNSIPTRADIERRLPLLDYTQVDVDETAGTAFIRTRGVTVNLGGIGKGYAVDRAATMLRRAGFNDFMIQFGGDLYLGGRRGDRPWRAAIRDPRGAPDTFFAALDLSDETFSTSGDYERYFLANGRRYHHIIDPDSGEPPTGSRSVTLVTRRAVLADAIAKGVFILGPARGLALIERLPDVEGVIVSSRNEVLVSSGLKERLIRTGDPTDAP